MESDSIILKKIERGERPSFDEVKQLSRENPYMVWPLLWMLDHDPDVATQAELRRKIAVLVGSRDTLRILLGEDSEEFASFYPDMKRRTLNTEDTIDTFLDQFGKKDVLIEPGGGIAVAPAIDYASTIAGESDGKEANGGASDATSSAIDSFLGRDSKEGADDGPGTAIATEEELEAAPNPKDVAHSTTTTLSESLAFAMIKKHNYKGALQIISELSLINPEKSVYFADQIRFLKKLIVLESKNKN